MKIKSIIVSMVFILYFSIPLNAKEINICSINEITSEGNFVVSCSNNKNMTIYLPADYKQTAPQIEVIQRQLGARIIIHNKENEEVIVYFVDYPLETVLKKLQ